MKKILAEIQDGTFAKDWILENKANRPHFNAMRKKEKELLIEKVGAELRTKMLWNKDQYKE
jgi:ketol-acid reductoisomerase